MSDAARLAAIRERAEKATPGPWSHYYAKELRPGMGGPTNEVNDTDRQPVVFWTGFDRGNYMPKQIKANAAFIAHARADIPWHLEENARLSSEVAALRAETIEECAKVARTVPVPGYYNQSHERTWMSARIAAYDAIRALAATACDEVKP
jgi:hypothetical protein